MAKSIAVVNVAANATFQILIDRVNDVILAVNSEVVTANASVSGALTTGNAYVAGVLGGATLVANGTLRGGNVSVTNTLYVTSNVNINSSSLFVTNSTSNVTILPNALTVANTTKSVAITPLTVSIGNSTVNTFANATNIICADIDSTIANVVSGAVEILTSNTITVGSSITVSNVFITNTYITVGNTTANMTMNSTSIQMSNTTGNYQVGFGDIVSNTVFSQRFLFTNVTTTGTSQQTIDSFAISATRSVDYFLSVKDNAANNYMTVKMACLHFGGNVMSTQYAVLASNSNLGTFVTDANATHGILKFTPTSTNTTINFVRTNIPA